MCGGGRGKPSERTHAHMRTFAHDMKRRFIIILTLIIAFALFACALSACAETPSSPPSDPPENGTGDDRPTDPDDGHGGGSDGDTDGDTDGDGSGQTDAFSQRALLARLADAFVGGGNMALTADGELRTGDFVIVAEGLTCALDASEGVMMRGDAVRIALTRGEDTFTHSGEFFVGLGEESIAYFEDEETGALRADEDVDAYVIGRYGEELADAATLLTRLATGDLSALLGMGGGLTATGGEAVELIYALADFGGYETGEAGTVERTESGATLTFSYDADGLTDLLSSAHSALTEPPASLTDADVLGVFDNVGELFSGNMTLSDVLAITADTFVGSGVAPRKMLDAMMCAFGLPAPGDGELGMTLNGYIGRATDYADNYASVLASARESLRELSYTPLAERDESARELADLLDGAHAESGRLEVKATYDAAGALLWVDVTAEDQAFAFGDGTRAEAELAVRLTGFGDSPVTTPASDEVFVLPSDAPSVSGSIADGDVTLTYDLGSCEGLTLAESGSYVEFSAREGGMSWELERVAISDPDALVTVSGDTVTVDAEAYLALAVSHVRHTSPDADVSEFALVGPQAIGLRLEGTYKGRHVAFDSYATLRGRTSSDA